MAAISTTPQTVDSTRAYQVTARKPDGTVYAFAGTEALACRVAPRGGGATLATPDVAFLVAASGTLTVTVRASQVAALGPGTYNVEVLATPASGAYSGEPLSVWSGEISFVAGGTAAASTAGWTVAKLERRLVAPRRGWMTQANLDTSVSGSNADLAGPIARSIGFFGGAVADPARVVDADLAAVAGREDAVQAVADYLLVEAIVGNQDSVTLYWADRRAEYSDWSKRAREELARLEARVRRMYGYGTRRRRPRVAPLSAGSAWPPAPPPPAGIGPYPASAGPAVAPDFNP